MDKALYLKTLLVMKITAFLLFCASLELSAAGFSQNITLSKKNASLEQLFPEIERQSGYFFLYQDELLMDTRKIDLDVRDATLQTVLDLCFKDQPVTYKIFNRNIVVKRKIEISGITGIDIKGKVVNEKGEALEGAAIIVKDTKKGTQTDPLGNFELKNVEKNATLIVSFTGFQSKMIQLNGEPFLTISLTLSTSPLDQVQVIAYGTVSKRYNTGDVTTVISEDIQKQPVTDPMTALEGRVPGLYIQQSSGIPGASLNILLRGQNSIANGNDPLYIVDGVPFPSESTLSGSFTGATTLSPFNNIAPSDIESIEVLKDADATAIYGSRGANGVILITTKKGKAGKTKLDLNISTGAGDVAHTLKLLNTQQYLQMRHEAFNNDGQTPGPTDYDINGTWDSTRYTDWQKVLVGNTAQLTNVQGNLSGGNANTQFLVGGSYTKQTTVFPGDFNDQKASLHINLTHISENQRFHLGLSASYLNDNNYMPTEDLTYFYLFLAPDAPTLYDARGNLNWQNNTWTNPLAILRQKSTTLQNILISSLNLGYKIIDGLQLNCMLGYNLTEGNQLMIEPITSYNPIYSSFQFLRRTYIANSGLKTWIVEPQIHYNKRIGKGMFDFILGSTFQENVQNSLAQFGLRYSTDALLGNLTAAATTAILGQTYTQYRYNAAFGRLNYIWQEKYLFNFTARRDGSSRFGQGNQFGNFGAIGLGWIFSKESFFQKSFPFLSFGKLRTSYGVTGNDQIMDYQFLSTYTPYSPTYQGITGLYPASLANPDYSWEENKKLEIAIELGFIKDRILMTAVFYRNRSSDQLVGYPLPSITGFSSVVENLHATVQNSGQEFTVNTINIKQRNFTWTTSFNISAPQNKLIEFPNLAGSGYANSYIVGKSLFIAMKYHFAGVNDSAGIYQFADGKGSPTYNPSYPQDLVPTRPLTQSLFGGFGNNFAYKRWQFDFFFQFVKQFKANYVNATGMPGTFGQVANQPTTVLNRWQKPGDKTNIERFSQDYGSLAYTTFSYATNSDFAYSDASFIRLKNLSLSYMLPIKWQQKVHLQNARIYLTGQNLLTFTKYLNIDPETSGLPPIRVITAGIHLTL